MNKFKELSIRFHEKSMKMSDIRFTFYIQSLVLIYFMVTIPIELMITGVENLPSTPIFDEPSSLGLFVSVIIWIPYIETILFHIIPLGIYYKLKDKFKLNMHWDFLVWGLCGLNFGILHAINYPGFTMKGFDFTLIGCIYSYVFYRYRKLGRSSTKGIWVIHALNNLIVMGPTLIDFYLFNKI